MKKRMYIFWGLIGVTVSLFVVCVDLILGRDDFVSNACKVNLVNVEKVQNFECINWTICIATTVTLIVIFIFYGLVRNSKNKK